VIRLRKVRKRRGNNDLSQVLNGYVGRPGALIRLSGLCVGEDAPPPLIILNRFEYRPIHN
jgi:hypothetical protein